MIVSPQVIGRSPSHRGSACLRYSMLLFELYSLRVYSIIYQIYQPDHHWLQSPSKRIR